MSTQEKITVAFRAATVILCAILSVRAFGHGNTTFGALLLLAGLTETLSIATTGRHRRDTE